QNVYSPAHPEEQGIPLALTISEALLQGRGACRVHGGGFAGTIQAYVPEDLLDSYRAGMEKVFGQGSCYVLTVRSCGGVKVEL
ncbi:MAG: galactokinase, partial [Acutalibacter sp.]|nr:galactokinase [Acutalibacter sp.]